MTRLAAACGLFALTILPVAPATQSPYAVTEKGPVFELRDARADTTVSIVPSVGNVAVSMQVKGAEILRFPYASVEEFRKAPRLSGIPFMGPWANRLDELGFYANGRHYTFNPELGNVRGPRPIHGFLSSTSRWQVSGSGADSSAAWITSRLEFYREPDWMAQFPFAHVVEMTYRLREGALEVATRIENLSAQPMPVSIGYHPYFQLTDSPRDAWVVSLGARTEWLLSPDKIPTGETRPIAEMFTDPARISLKDFDLDHVFGDLVRDESGRAVMSVKGRSQQLDVVFGPNYRAAVVYAPRPRVAAGAAGTTPAQNFICFEPMVAITNAMNLAHRGLYKELQSVPPGGVWEESFWIRTSGF
ncbi:MAG TPA: aldose 1-epimerase [Vicinamibacterales bacterium]|nr:aldose 1-epimerase [Vicinamibacterales bacterium]